MNNIYIEAGKRIRKVRENKNYTRDYVAIKADISSKFLYEIENGLKGFSADTLYRIAQTLEVSTEYILSGNNVDGDVMEIEKLLHTFTPEQMKYFTDIIKIIFRMIK